MGGGGSRIEGKFSGAGLIGVELRGVGEEGGDWIGERGMKSKGKKRERSEEGECKMGDAGIGIMGMAVVCIHW